MEGRVIPSFDSLALTLGGLFALAVVLMLLDVHARRRRAGGAS
jgi:hypothetical protein